MSTKTKKPFYKRWWFIVLAVIVIISVISSLSDDSPKEQSETTNVAKTKVKKIGDTITFDDSEWTVLEATNKGSQLKSNNRFQQDLVSEDGVYYIVKFKVKNLTNAEERVLSSPKIKDDKDREFNEIDMQTFYLPENAKSFALEAIPASMTRTFYGIYEVASDANTVYFEARSLSAFPKKKLILLDNLN